MAATTFSRGSRLSRTALLLLAAACGGSSTDTGPTPQGTLAVTVSAPSGVAAQVTVSGPDGYSQSLSASRTLSSLAPGSYTITANAGASSDDIVGSFFPVTVTGSPATVTAGASSQATVTYASSGSPGRLWVSNALGLNVLGYSAAQLAATGAPAPTVTIGGNDKAGSHASSLAMDGSGGMWIADNSDTLFYFSASQIVTSTSQSPVRKVIGANGSVVEIIGITFDGAGNLWFADQRDRVGEYSAAQLAAGGTVAPSVILTSSFGSIVRPWSVAFDAHGNLWVCNYGNNSIASFTPAQIAVSGAPTPSAGLTGTSGLDGPLSIAFDHSGNLWVSSVIDTVAEFSASNLTGIGSPAPAIVISGSDLDSPQGIAFDESGALWVAAYQGDRLLRFLPSQLLSSGAPAPSTIISGSNLLLPTTLLFAPHSSALPLH